MPPRLCSQIEDMATRLENDFPIFDSKDEEYEKAQLIEAMRLFQTWYSFVDGLAKEKHEIKMFFMANIPFYALDKEISAYEERKDESAKEKQIAIQKSYVKQLTQYLKEENEHSIVPVEIFTHHFIKTPRPTTNIYKSAKILYDKKIKKQKQYNSKPSKTYAVQLVNNSNKALELALKANDLNNPNSIHPIEVLVTKWRERINKGYVYCDTQGKQSEAETAVQEALRYGNLDTVVPFLHVMIPIYAAKHFFEKVIWEDNYGHYRNKYNQLKSQIAEAEERVVAAYKMRLVSLYAEKKNIGSAIEFEAFVVFLMHPLHHTSKFTKIFKLDSMMRELGGLIHAYRTGQKTSNEEEKLKALVEDSQTGQSPPSAEYVVAMQMRKENIAILLPKKTQVKGVTCLLTRVRQAKEILQYRLEDMWNQLDKDISEATLQQKEINNSQKYQTLLLAYETCDINTEDEKYKGKKKKNRVEKKHYTNTILEPFRRKAESLGSYNKNAKTIPIGVINTRCNKYQDVDGLVSKALTNVKNCTSAIIALLDDEELMYLSIKGSKRDTLKGVLEVVRQTVERVGNFIDLLEKLRKDKQSRKPLSYITSKLTEFNGDIHNCLKESALLLQGDGQFPN